MQHVLVATFAFGVFLHGATLVAGSDWLLDNVLTPTVDVGLLIPMVYTTVMLWRLRHHAQHSSPWHRPAYFALNLYMAVTVVVHLETLFTWEVSYVDRFPSWYSALIIPLQLSMLVFAARLRFRSQTVDVRVRRKVRADMDEPAGSTSTNAHRRGEAERTTRTLLRGGGAVGVAAGALTIIANVLHPPRTFAGFEHAPLEPAWEYVHALGIVAFIATLFALIALFAHHVQRGRAAGLFGFSLAVTGVVLLVGVLAADAFIFPVLARNPATAFLLEVPGPIIPNSSFAVLMALSAVTYNLGYILFSIAGWRAALLPRPGFVLMAVGVVPLSVGALAFQGLDIGGAFLLGTGHIVLGHALWSDARTVD